jgi:hypothetical protein
VAAPLPPGTPARIIGARRLFADSRAREIGIKKKGVSSSTPPDRQAACQRFFPPFFLPPFAVFFAIIPPWNVAAQLCFRFPRVTTGGLSGPPSYNM